MVARVAALVAVVASTSTSQLSANPLALDPAQPLELVCETQATQVAPDARVTAGKLRLKLDTSVPAKDGAVGTWSPIDRDSTHLGSLAERHREACKDGCPLFTAKDGTLLELWTPRRTTIDKMSAGEALTVAVVDGATGKLKASTFLDQQIASLEQGDCARAP